MELGLLVKRVRKMTGDRPPRSRMTNSDIIAGTNPVNITLPTGHAGLMFPTRGALIEFDDGTGEVGLVDATDLGTDVISVYRAQEGSTAAAHAQGCALLHEPRFEFDQIADAMDFVIDSEFQPAIWVPGETKINLTGASEFYAAEVDDVEEVSYAYQIISGSWVRVHVGYLSPEMSDNTQFPHGAFMVRDALDSSTLYIAFRRRCTLDNLTTSQERLLELGVVGHLMMLEETVSTAPGAGQLDRRVSEGATIRAGAVLWERFKNSLAVERVNLVSDEQQGTRLFSWGG